MIGALHLTIRADALNAVRRQFGLLLGNEIRQSLAYFGISEGPLAVLTGESPTCHNKLWRPVMGVRIPKFVYSSRNEFGRGPIPYGYFLGSVASGSASIVTSNFAPFFSATSFPDSS